MTVVSMSLREIERVKVLGRVEDGRLGVTAAAGVLGLSRRQMHRLLAAWRTGGAQAIVSKRRGQPSNRAYLDSWRQLVLDTVARHYDDFGPTLAAEMLETRHGLIVGHETLRRWMADAGIWVTRAARRARIHQPRNRRERPGELIQIDGSDHHWFEDRAGPCTLLVFIDDATSALMHLRFVPSESAFAYFEAVRGYVARHGCPLAFYSDRHSVFHVAARSDAAERGVTQFGRAMQDIGIEVICANPSEAKGRVERANRTLQDRLVKAMRLDGISDMASANAWLPDFIDRFNARFARPAVDGRDAHRPAPDTADLDRALSWQAQRTVSAALSVQYDRMLLLIDPARLPAGATPDRLARSKVLVSEWVDGRLELSWRGLPVAYRVFDKERRVTPGDVVENKLLGPVLELIRQQQEAQARSPHRGKGPARSGQTGGVFAGRERAGFDDGSRPVSRAVPLRVSGAGSVQRTVSAQLTFQHGGVRHTLIGLGDPRAAVGQQVRVDTDEAGVVSVHLGARLVRTRRTIVKVTVRPPAPDILALLPRVVTAKAPQPDRRGPCGALASLSEQADMINEELAVTPTPGPDTALIHGFAPAPGSHRCAHPQTPPVTFEMSTAP